MRKLRVSLKRFVSLPDKENIAHVKPATRSGIEKHRKNQPIGFFPKNSMGYSPKLISLIKKCDSWSELHLGLTEINNRNPKEAGNIFEEFTKLYFLADREARAKFRNVWKYSEVPHEIRQKLDVRRKEHGIDLVFETKDKLLFAVQCKFKNDQSCKLSWTKDRLSSWLSGSQYSDGRILFTNASGVDSETERVARRKRFRFYSIADLLQIERGLIKNMLAIASSKPIGKPQIKKPRPDQKEAIEAVIKGFKTNDRGQLILPCGAGKTLVSLWIAEKLKAGRVLVLVPSLSLLKQIKDEWLQNQKTVVPYLCVCSDSTVDEARSKDHHEINSFEVDENVTTDPKVILKHLRRHPKSIIFSTYQSTPSLQRCLKRKSIKFDLAVCDEAHRTAGPIRDTFGLIHNNKHIPARRRLYMTATPRILSPQAKAMLKSEHLKLVADMSDPGLFGREFFRRSFADAIRLGILVDYKIISILVTDREVLSNISQRKLINKETSVDEVAHNVALRKAFRKYRISHAITFHSRVSGARSFVERHEKLFPNELNLDFVSGMQATSERQIKLTVFAKAKKSVLANARCLTEGVDVPNIDCVYFCDPRKSVIDIVQATGRALRKSRDRTKKKCGYIIVPTFHPESGNEEQVVNDTVFANLISVIRAMGSQDQRLMDEIKEVRLAKGKRKKIPTRIVIDLDEKINLGRAFSKESLERSIHLNVIEKIPVGWRSFEDARRFVQKIELSNADEWSDWAKSQDRPVDIPIAPDQTYRNKGWISWGDFLGTGNVAFRLRQYRKFGAAREFVRSLRLKSYSEWKQYCNGQLKKVKPLPPDIPKAPDQTYQDRGWVSWGDWLGTGSVASFNMKFRGFEAARKFVRKLRLVSRSEWERYCKSGKKPSDIPSIPNRTYASRGWVSWGDWLGTGSVAPFNRTYRPFKAARKFVHRKKLASVDEWIKYCKSGEKPDDIPSDPYRVYAGKGWVSYPDWLGNKNQYWRDFRSFHEARKYVRKLNFSSQKDWRLWVKSKARPLDIPSNPDKAYKNSGWISWGDWLGTGRTATKLVKYTTFKKARKFSRKLGLRSSSEWREFCNSGRKPANIPAYPDRSYSKAGWISWPDWLGKK